MSRRRGRLLVLVPAILLTFTMVVQWPLRQVRTAPRQEALFTVNDVPDNIVINEAHNSLCIQLQMGHFVRSAEVIGPDFRSMTPEQVKQTFADQMNIWLHEYNSMIAREDVKRFPAVQAHWAEALAASSRCRTFNGDCCCCYVSWPGKWSSEISGLCERCKRPYECNYVRICRTPLTCQTTSCYGPLYDCSSMEPCSQPPAGTCP